MRYDKQNRKLFALQEELDDLKRKNERVIEESQNVKDILTSTLHEVRRFSLLLSSFSDKLMKDTAGQYQVNQTVQSVFYAAGMISSRLAYTDIELNPLALENQTVVRAGIFKKFDKARKMLLDEARARRINIRLEGESRVEIDALPVFELLPFVLLENGIKYSPPDQAVNIIFESINRQQVVTVGSVGPKVAHDELPRLFEKGFRGRQVVTLPGQGLGLFLAKRICDFHDARVRIEVGDRDLYQIGGISYSEFRVVLQF